MKEKDLQISLNKKKVLFITTQLPFPAISGGVIKTYKTISYLSTQCLLSVSCLLKDDNLQNLEACKSHFNNVNFINLVSHQQERSIFNLIKSYLYNKPLSVFRHFNKDFGNSISRVWNNYDIIFIDHYLMIQYVQPDSTIPIILHQHNAEYKIWERFYLIEENFIRRAFIKLESARIKKYEKKIINNVQYILAAPEDIPLLQKLKARRSNTKFFETLHLGDENLLKRPKLKFNVTNKKRLLFIGTLTWEANVDGLLWFIKNIWDQIKIFNKEIYLDIVGRNPDVRLVDIAKNDKQIILHGFIEDLEKFYLTSSVFISPVRFGSGIKVKNINAMYRGLPLITTTIGIESIKAKDETHFMLANSKIEWIDKLNMLLNKEDIWEKISINSRKLMFDEYTWEKVFKNFDEILNDIK